MSNNIVSIKVDKSLGKIVITTDDLSIKYFLEARKTEKTFIPWKRSWGVTTTTTKIYDGKRTKNGVVTYYIGLGWAGYLIRVLGNNMTKEDYDDLLKDAIYADILRDIPFSELRDYQNEDVLHLLKYKRGLLNVYTSYGKTQSIAVLANFLHTVGKRVLIVAPGKKAMDELVKRCKALYNLDIPSPDLSINCIITSGLLNRNDIKDLNKRTEFENLMKTYDVVLVDEVEYTMNSSGEYLFSTLATAERFYAFSGTADKQGGEMISFVNGLSDVVCNNKDIIKWFGPSLVFRMPLTIKIDMIEVQTYSLDAITFDPGDFSDDQNVYTNVMNKIWTNPEVCKLVVKIAKRFPKLFIPINNLRSILNEWITKYFIGVFRILLVCGEGYIYYDLQGNKQSLTLAESCEKIKNNEVDIIPSTSSGYRALDFPNIENILLIQGKIAGVVLQSVGRVARGNHMNIITLASKFEKNIPIFTKGSKSRNEMIHKYYKYCEILDSRIFEEDL